MNRKEYELVMQIKAAVGSDFNRAFSNSSSTVKNLQKELLIYFMHNLYLKGI